MRHFGFDSKNKLNILQFFKLRYGIGKKISKILCNHLGINTNYKYSYLTVNFYYSRSKYFFIRKLPFLDNRLIDYIISRHKYLIQLNSYRGLRIVQGYPSKGQRTRSNSRTAARARYTVKFQMFNAD
jgi:small subunit ribosomal protein S13